MMKTKHSESLKAEEYARALLDAASSEGRQNDDLVQWRHAGKFSREVFEVIHAMCNAGDLNLVKLVESMYKHLLDTRDSTVFVTVTTAVPMDDNLREKVRAHMEKQVNSSVFLVERVDKNIIGGIIVESQGNRYDASVRSQLARIRKELSQAYQGKEM